MNHHAAHIADPWIACAEPEEESGARGVAESGGTPEAARFDVDALTGWDDLPGDHDVLWFEGGFIELVGGRAVPRHRPFLLAG